MNENSNEKKVYEKGEKIMKTPITNCLNSFIGSDKVDNFNKCLEISAAVDRSIIIGEIDEELGAAVENVIRFWNAYDKENDIPVEKRAPIKIYIDSPGGYLSSTFTAIDAIQLSETPIWTINIGCAYSGGFFIFIAGHRRIAYENSSFLYHEGSVSLGGDAHKFENSADFYKKQRAKLKNLTLKYTGITEEEYNEHIKDDWYLFSDEALRLKIADEIATKFE